MKLKLEGNKKIWWIVAILMLISLVSVYSSIGNLAYLNRGGNTTFYLLKHGLLLALGFAIIYGMHKTNIIRFSKLAQFALIVGVILLVFTMLFGLNLNSAKRVLPLGFGLTFQPSDIARVGLIMYLSRILALKQDVITDFKKGFLHVIIPIIVVCGLIVTANFSTAALVFIVSIVLLYIGRVSIKHLLMLLGIGGIAIILLFLIAKVNPEFVPRITTWENRIENFFSSDDNGEENYQALQSKIAIASGWPMGKVIGHSTQRNFLPQSYNDFIYAIIIEQTGLLGAIGVLMLYLALFSQCTKIAAKTKNNFGKFLVLGIGFSITFQAFTNMMVATGLIPVTGQPLPLISMGGTSILITCFSIGIILSVSRTTEMNRENKEINEATK